MTIIGTSPTSDTKASCRPEALTVEERAELVRLAESVEVFDGPWEVIHGHIWCKSRKGGDTKFIDIRGWGYLTGQGHGGLALPEEQAAKIQDALGEYVAAANPQTIKRYEATIKGLEAALEQYVSLKAFLGGNLADFAKEQFARAEAAEQRAKELEAQLNETYTDLEGTVWTRPTAEAYARVCGVKDMLKLCKRTPGTVEVCDVCGERKDKWDPRCDGRVLMDISGDYPETKQHNCPIRSQVSTVAKETTTDEAQPISPSSPNGGEADQQKGGETKA